jgi:hypothetical protein
MLSRTIFFGLMGNILILIGTSQPSISVPVLKESFSVSLSHHAGHACQCSFTAMRTDDNESRGGRGGGGQARGSTTATP